MLPVVSLDLGRGEGGVRRHGRGGQRHGQPQGAQRRPAGLSPPIAETQRIMLTGEIQYLMLALDKIIHREPILPPAFIISVDNILPFLIKIALRIDNGE